MLVRNPFIYGNTLGVSSLLEKENSSPLYLSSCYTASRSVLCLHRLMGTAVY